MNYNFTDRVRKVLAMAREEAIRLKHDYVGTEHILLGLIREGEGVAAAVLANLAEWGRRRVVFLITHRLSTIRHADQILVVNDGRIVERGNHVSLVQSNGSYRKWLRSSVSDSEPRAVKEPGRR